MTQLACGSEQLNKKAESEDFGCHTTSSCCDSPGTNKGTNSTSCCDQSGPDESTTKIDMSITIDGQVIKVEPDDKNIVDVASRAKIGIPAACYRAQRKKGCCHGCVVEIDGEQNFACSTPPVDGMNIVVDREDLKAIRKKNLLKYNEGIKNGNFIKCSVTGSSECSC